MNPGAPGSAMPRRARRAITAAAYRRLTYRRAVGEPGLRVVRAVPKLPFGRSRHARARLVHRPVAVFLAFERGALLGALVEWQCGGYSPTFELLRNGVTGELCWKCKAAHDHARP